MKKNLLLLSKWPEKNTVNLFENYRNFFTCWKHPISWCCWDMRWYTPRREQYDFKLNGNLKLAQDLVSSHNSFKEQGPPLWEKFSMWCSSTAISQNLYKESATQSSNLCFQSPTITHKLPPLHVYIAQAIHDFLKSKTTSSPDQF